MWQPAVWINALLARKLVYEIRVSFLIQTPAPLLQWCLRAGVDLLDDGLEELDKIVGGGVPPWL